MQSYDTLHRFKEIEKKFKSLPKSLKISLQITLRILTGAGEFWEGNIAQYPLLIPLEHQSQSLALFQKMLKFCGTEIEDEQPLNLEWTLRDNLISIMLLLGIEDVHVRKIPGAYFHLLGCDFLHIPDEFTTVLIKRPCIEINKLFKCVKTHPLQILEHEPAMRNVVLCIAYGCSLLSELLPAWIWTHEASELLQSIVDVYNKTKSRPERHQTEPALAHCLRALCSKEGWDSQYKDSGAQWLQNLKPAFGFHTVPVIELAPAIDKAILRLHKEYLSWEPSRQIIWVGSFSLKISTLLVDSHL